MAEYVIETPKGKWEVVCGLEIHCQIISKSKIYSGASTEFGADPNEHVSFVDAGMPGMLPTLNEECVHQAVKTGIGLRAKINKYSNLVNYRLNKRGIRTDGDWHYSGVLITANGILISWLSDHTFSVFRGTIANVFPRAPSNLSRVSILGQLAPFSILAITGCLIPVISSSCFCDIPFS